MGAIRARYPLEKLFDLLRRPDSVGGMGLRKRIKELGDGEAQAWLDGMVDRAFFYLASNREAIRRLKDEARKTTFKRTAFIGRNGRREGCNPDTIEKVLDALLTIAEERSSLDPMVGISYQLPAKTGLPVTTCRRGIQALEALGWIGDVTEVPSENGAQNAYSYRLLTDPMARKDPPGRAMPPRKHGPQGQPVASAGSYSSDSYSPSRTQGIYAVTPVP